MYALRTNILEGFAGFLIVDNKFEQVEYAFVLSGNAFDRGNKAAELYHEGKVTTLVCTGANISNDIKSLGIDTLESDLTHLQLLKNGVPETQIIKFPVGTSTLEESDFILSYCQEKDILELVVISSKFHTRRIHQVFTNKFAEQGIDVFIAGAKSSRYIEEVWWENEYGLIALNNEYLKQIYYLIKY
jgi:uncharacterized SAM-binding protein YcdF (DUF218 family)|tara:strand:- start:10679 stop:11239 length:561 start_codon:yes stop_codon:yes gene_type:complete